MVRRVKHEPTVSVLSQPETGEIAVVIHVGPKLFDVPLTRQAARKLIRDVQAALGQLEN